MKRAAIRNVFGSPPASTVTRVTRRALWVALMASAFLTLHVQFRRPATLLPYRGVLRVGARQPCWITWIGRKNLLFRDSLGLTKHP